MVKSIEIKNFRGFENFEASGLALINVIVGDNAVGKTALLEAIFLTLSGSPDKGVLLKQWRGLDFAFQNGSADSVYEGIYADLFHDPKSDDPISIRLTGRGFENRELTISRSGTEITIPTKDVAPNRHVRRSSLAYRTLDTILAALMSLSVTSRF
jgi:hypothetical protein